MTSTYALLLVFGGFICLAGLMGYWLGLRQSQIVYKLRTLEKPKPEPTPAPTVTLGSYTPPQTVASTDTSTPTGLVDAKTPERLQFEADEALKHEALS